MNNTYFPAIEHYPYIDTTSEMLFFPKSANRKRHKGGIDSLPRKINFQDLLTWVEDNITFPSTSTNFTITDGTTSSVINNGETITFQDGTGINFSLSGNTVTAALVSASVPNIYTQDGTIDDALRTVNGGAHGIFWTNFALFAIVTPTSFSISNAGALTMSSSANASLTASGTLQLNGAGVTNIAGNTITILSGSAGALTLTTPDGATNSIRQYSLLQAQNATGNVEFTPYAFPSADGTSGQVLSTNGSGTLTWGAPTVENLFTSNLTLAANRTHDLATYDFHFSGSDGEVHIYLTSVPDYSELIVNKTGIYAAADDSTDSSILQVMNTGRINMTASQGIRINGATASTVTDLRFYEASTNGSSYLAFKAPTSLATTTTWTLPSADGSSRQLLMTNGSGTLSFSYPEEVIIIACSDETTALTTGTAKVTFRMPYKFNLSAVKASVTTAPTGSVLTVDINEAGVSILSTKLTIDATEKTSTSAATPAVISDSALADDAEITIDIDTVGSSVAGAGLKIYLSGQRVP